MTAANGNKEIVYVDIDDEITAVIDKVRNSKQKIVALVLPKRATMLQSIVNMKLLKRASDEASKHLVLITSESGLMPLAGAVGLYVAKTLQSKPEIPAAPKTIESAANESIDVPASGMGADSELDKSRSVGELAAASDSDLDGTIELDNEPPTSAGRAGGVAAGFAGRNAGKNATKDKKLKIPNFESFRTRLIVGGAALILVIIGWYFAFYVMPKATVIVKTDSSQINTDITLTASTTAQAIDEERTIVPAISKELRKTDTEKVATTGEKDMGTKATGEVRLSTACTSRAPTIPAGTTVSTSNLAFVTDDAVTLNNPSVDSQGNCRFSNDVDVTAQSAGEQYNVSSGKTFSVSGYSGVTGTNSSAMSGGTTRIVKIVSQKDIDSAKTKLQERNTELAKTELAQTLEDEDYISLNDTLKESEPAITSSPNVGDEASEVTVTSSITYTMLGVKEGDLKKLIEKEVEDDIDEDKQMILSYGLDDAVLRVDSREDASARLTLQALVEAGPQLDADAIKQEVAGKKKGQARDLIETRPGIQSAEVSYSPFWVASAPKNPNKITVVFEAGNNQQNDEE